MMMTKPSSSLKTVSYKSYITISLLKSILEREKAKELEIHTIINNKTSK